VSENFGPGSEVEWALAIESRPRVRQSNSFQSGGRLFLLSCVQVCDRDFTRPPFPQCLVGLASFSSL
jgi:hypothetical protein